MSQYFNQADELLDEDAPDLLADMMLNREAVSLQTTQPDNQQADKTKASSHVGKQ